MTELIEHDIKMMYREIAMHMGAETSRSNERKGLALSTDEIINAYRDDRKY